MTYDEFRDRYLSFWQSYNPGKPISKEILQSANRYFRLFSDEKIDFATIDRILTIYEKENKELPYTFNIVAYILDWVIMERLEAAQNRINLDKMPIILPYEGKPIRIVDKPFLAKAIEKIKKNCPGLYKILERINAHRLGYRYEYCYACNNVGMIIFSVFVDPTTKKKTEKYNQIDDNHTYTVVYRCVCSKGNNISKQILQAKKEECMEIAKINKIT